jgi:leucyl/phenylalanyl-tRNA---protein transferase
MGKLPHPIPWLSDGEAFPPVSAAWDVNDPAPGLLAAGSTLEVDTLVNAYSQGIFPWFSVGQPVLWWSPDPRMVLKTENFRLHLSLRKTLLRFRSDDACEVRFDSAFKSVIKACATTPRLGQTGTWIVPDMVESYTALHAAGHAHSVETWVRGDLVGGLYCVNLGGMVFGESMFAHATDASKIAIAALVAFCLHHGISMIDCQQNTRHLASLGASEIERELFLAHVINNVTLPPPTWKFKPLYWNELLIKRTPSLP